jgi:hypothetical protein
MNKRLELSAKTIWTWEAIGRPGGRSVDDLRMIREELKILATISDSRARELERRYGSMANKIRLSLA